uniref:Uncharacterized protein n=1 Tax=viral metagenome TaxID=1070528 RepID=A0A6C0JX18_9ZZZZ
MTTKGKHNFKCFGKYGDGNHIGDCIHKDFPQSGAWMIAPSQYKKIEDLLAKYACLVSYARSKTPYVEVHPALQRYPKECDKVKDPNDDNWTHGFNSGMLAALRLINSIVMQDYKEILQIENGDPGIDPQDEDNITDVSFSYTAFEWFPHLDS